MSAPTPSDQVEDLPGASSKDFTSPRGRPERRTFSHDLARRIAAVLAVALVVSLASWMWLTIESAEACIGRDDCVDPTSGQRWLLVGWAGAAALLGLAVATYLARFARVGRVWRRARELAVAYGVATVSWTVAAVWLRFIT